MTKCNYLNNDDDVSQEKVKNHFTSQRDVNDCALKSTCFERCITKA